MPYFEDDRTQDDWYIGNRAESKVPFYQRADITPADLAMLHQRLAQLEDKLREAELRIRELEET